MSSRFICVTAYDKYSFLLFLFKAKYYSIVCMHQILFIHLSVNDICLAFTSWLLSIMLLWTWLCKYLWDPAFSSFRYKPRSEITGSYGNSTFNFFRQLNHFIFPPIVHKDPNFSMSLLTLAIFCLFLFW